MRAAFVSPPFAPHLDDLIFETASVRHYLGPHQQPISLLKKIPPASTGGICLRLFSRRIRSSPPNSLADFDATDAPSVPRLHAPAHEVAVTLVIIISAVAVWVVISVRIEAEAHPAAAKSAAVETSSAVEAATPAMEAAAASAMATASTTMAATTTAAAVGERHGGRDGAHHAKGKKRDHCIT
jgi:hypothetical protein